MKLYIIDQEKFVISDSYETIKAAFPKNKIARLKTDFILKKKTVYDNRRKLDPTEIKSSEHLAIIAKIFNENQTVIRKDLVKQLSLAYKVGFNKIEQKSGFLLYLIEQGFIQKHDAGSYTKVNIV